MEIALPESTLTCPQCGGELQVDHGHARILGKDKVKKVEFSLDLTEPVLWILK